MNQPSGISNRQTKRIRKLLRKKGRYKYEQFIVEGRRAVEQVVGNGLLQIELLCFDEEKQLWEQAPWQQYAQRLKAVSVDTADFRDLTDTDNPQGVLASVKMPHQSSIEEIAARNGVILALDALQDPGNLGTIVRSATWFGAAGLLVGKGTVDLFHPKVVRGTAGSTGRISYHMGDLSQMLDVLRAKGWNILMLDLDSEARSLKDLDSSKSHVLLAGSEAHGVSSEIRQMADQAVKISGDAEGQKYLDSLNAAVSVGIGLYELSG